jgi:signal transduction histidine kinase
MSPDLIGRATLASDAAAAHREGVRDLDATLAWLHDHTLQMLELIAAGTYDDRVSAERLREIAAAAADELRDYLENRPARAGIDLSAALRREVAEAALVSGALTVELDCPESLTGLTRAQIENISAAVREALTNVRKHARATRAMVTAKATATGAEVTVADDGVGFDVQSARRGLGLRRSVVSRMLSCGGSARVVSHPGHGTLIVLTAGSPLPRPLPMGLAA